MNLTRKLFSFFIWVAITQMNSTAALADAAKIKAQVALFPVGSFEVKSSELIGTGTRKVNRFTASELKVPVKSLVSGISLRDTHMREHLLEKEHPYVLAKDITQP